MLSGFEHATERALLECVSLSFNAIIVVVKVKIGCCLGDDWVIATKHLWCISHKVSSALKLEDGIIAPLIPIILNFVFNLFQVLNKKLHFFPLCSFLKGRIDRKVLWIRPWLYSPGKVISASKCAWMGPISQRCLKYFPHNRCIQFVQCVTQKVSLCFYDLQGRIVVRIRLHCSTGSS